MDIINTVRRISYLTHHKITFEKEFWIFDEPIIFRTNSPVLLETAEETFIHYQKSTSFDREPLVITLVDIGEENEVNEINPSAPSFHTIGNIFLINLDRDNAAVADLTTGYAHGFLSPGVIRNRSFVRYNFIEALCQAMLGPTRNFLHIHAACIHKCGTSIILQGKAGSGKSTIAYACVRSGYQLLAEDVVHIKFIHDEIRLWGAPWKFHLLPDAKQFFPELESITPSVQMNGEWKLELEINKYHPESTITNSKPGPIITIFRNQLNTTSLKEVSRETALEEFEFIWPWMGGWSDEHESAARRLLSNGIYHLYTSKSITEPVRLLDELVQNFARSD